MTDSMPAGPDYPMTTLADLVAQSRENNDRFKEHLRGMLAGDEILPDGTPLNGDTIGRLMDEHRDDIEQWASTGGDE